MVPLGCGCKVAPTFSNCKELFDITAEMICFRLNFINAMIDHATAAEVERMT